MSKKKKPSYGSIPESLAKVASIYTKGSKSPPQALQQ